MKNARRQRLQTKNECTTILAKCWGKFFAPNSQAFYINALCPIDGVVVSCPKCNLKFIIPHTLIGTLTEPNNKPLYHRPLYNRTMLDKLLNKNMLPDWVVAKGKWVLDSRVTTASFALTLTFYNTYFGIIVGWRKKSHNPKATTINIRE